MKFLNPKPQIKTLISVIHTYEAVSEAQPALMGPLLLGWMNEQLNVPGSARFPESSCGNYRVRMVDVSERL
jgi:hypothetical protein